MEHNNLIRMVNRIGDFFEAMPDRDEALEGISNHIRLFWEPRMRWQLLEILDRPQSDGDLAVSDIVKDAVTRNRERLTPAAPAPT